MYLLPRAEHVRFHIGVLERCLEQPIEVRGDDEPNEALRGQCRNGTVCSRRLFRALLAFVDARLHVRSQQLLPFGRGLADRVEQVRVVCLLAGRVPIPLFRIRLAFLLVECR